MSNQPGILDCALRMRDLELREHAYDSRLVRNNCALLFGLVVKSGALLQGTPKLPHPTGQAKLIPCPRSLQESPSFSGDERFLRKANMGYLETHG